MKYKDLRPEEIPDINADAIEATLQRLTRIELKMMMIFGLQWNPRLVVEKYRTKDETWRSIMCDLIYTSDPHRVFATLERLIEVATYILQYTIAPHEHRPPMGVWVYSEAAPDDED